MGLQCLKNVEKVHTFACKRFLNVPVRTPNKSVYGDLRRYLLYITVACDLLNIGSRYRQ